MTATSSSTRRRLAAMTLFALGVFGSGCHGCDARHRKVDVEATAKCVASQTESVCETCCKKENDRGHEHKGPGACTCVHRN